MSSPVIWISPESSVYEAAKLIAKKKIGALVVMREDAKLCGIISEKDIVTKVIADGEDYKSYRVEKAMTTDVYTVTADSTLLEISKMMNKYQIRHAVVTEDDKVVGIITARDLIDMVSG